MAGAGPSAIDMISQLEAARKLALGDPQVYNQVVPGILPIIGPSAAIDVRRWGADFLAEAFASPNLPGPQKEQLTSEVLSTLRTFLDNPAEDLAVVRSVIQASASIYPLVFKRIISNPDQAQLWQDMTAMKLNILQRMDGAPMPIRICCIKFIQKIVQVETPGLIADPRRADQNETSIALVPRNHPLLLLPNLEAEASGLLDRLLSVFQESSVDPIMIDATLNCLAVLIRTRQAIANKIISAVLNFNPMKQVSTPMTPRVKVIVRSMERTARALLRYTLRSMPNHPLEQKILAYLERLQQSRVAVFAEAPSLKRSAEPTDGLDDAKRQRLTEGTRKFPHMPPPPNSFAHLFTLTEDTMIQQFDVKLLPTDIVSAVAGVLLQHVDVNAMDDAINAVRARYVHLQKVSKPTPVPDVPMAGPTGIDDEDDYDPEFGLPTETTIAPGTEKALEELAQPAIDLGTFELPKPPPLTSADVSLLSDQCVNHVFEVVTSLDSAVQAPPRQKLGLNRLAASTNDRDAWVTIMTRLATRAASSLEHYVDSVSKTDEVDSEMVKSEPTTSDTEPENVANRIRQTLYMYVLDDFRARINVAISWLNEEWYADRVRAASNPELDGLPNYSRWCTRLIDRLLPYLDAKDKNILIRFLSEIPSIDKEILDRIKTLARDPERINMCMLAFQYLLMMRPPVREAVLDSIESVWQDGDAQAKSATAKVLAKWRPSALQQQTGVKKYEEMEKKGEEDNDTKTNGIKSKSPEQQLHDPRKRVPNHAPQPQQKASITAGNGN